MMHILNPTTTDKKHLYAIYEKLYHKNGIAFLGAGASVTNVKLLSKELIELYEGKINKELGTNNIIKFVDILQSTPGFHRNEFDKFVVDSLNYLEPGEGHQIFASIPWRLIYTTNFDTLVEDSYGISYGKAETAFKLNVVREKAQLDYFTAENEITYIKLNGCKSDLGRYKLVFSTEDFVKQKSYYKASLSRLKTLSSDVAFVSFGYSFTDDFSEYLFDLIEKQDYRQKRPIYCVDPYVNENNLDYYSSRNICMVKMTFNEFFSGYNQWFSENNKSYLSSLPRFSNPDKSRINLSTPLRFMLGNNIVQLDGANYAGNQISKREFYLGSEPNFSVISNGFDIIRTQEVSKVVSEIEKYFSTSQTPSLIPNLFVLQGSFGIGKTTSIYRAINEYVLQNSDTLAFEIIKPLELRPQSISNIISTSNATQFIFYCNNIEYDSVFKAFNDLRIELATAQISTIKILFISSIRENILNRYKNISKMDIKNLEEYQFRGKYTDQELGELLDILKDLGIKKFRDVEEKQSIINEIKYKCVDDSFLMIYELVENGEHIKFLIKAYEELDNDLQAAFKITALIHRFNMKCPVELVKNSIKNISWEDFTEKVIKGDGKNLLIQEQNRATNDEPDLFFRIRHSLIAKIFVEKTISDKELNSLYKSIFSNISYSNFNARFLIDLIKNIRTYDKERISEGQILKYLDLAKTEFQTSSHFMLGYVTNIERNTESIQRLDECIEELNILENNHDVFHRNHRIIHRKGSLNFKIAKILHREKSPAYEVKQRLTIAEEWFDIKKRLDPSSDFSYIDYLKLLMWQHETLKLTEEEKLEVLNKIYSLYQEAKRILFTKVYQVQELYDSFRVKFMNENDTEYLDFLLEQYRNPNNRVKATLLLYYYYEAIGEHQKANDFVEELKNYTDEKEVVLFLFKFYGRNLFVANNRIKFFDLVRLNENLEKEEPLRYYYFNSIAEFYNYSYDAGRSYLAKIGSIKQGKLNPDFFLLWQEEDGSARIFDAEILVDKKYKKVRVKAIYKTIPLAKGDYNGFSNGQPVKVAIKFLFTGLQAIIIDRSSEDDEDQKD